MDWHGNGRDIFDGFAPEEHYRALCFLFVYRNVFAFRCSLGLRPGPVQAVIGACIAGHQDSQGQPGGFRPDAGCGPEPEPALRTVVPDVILSLEQGCQNIFFAAMVHRRGGHILRDSFRLAEQVSCGSCRSCRKPGRMVAPCRYGKILLFRLFAGQERCRQVPYKMHERTLGFTCSRFFLWEKSDAQGL